MSAAGLATAAWCAASVPGALALRRALQDPARAQAQALQEIVQAHQDSAFGREHGFAHIRSPADFTRQVPARDYDALWPWIQAEAEGHAGTLTGLGPQDRVTRFEPTSGSSAAARLIPGNARLRAQFNRAIGPWVVDLYTRRPALLGGPAWWSVSPALPERRSPGGLPIGFADDTEYLSPLAQRLMRHALAVPGSVAKIPDVSHFLRVSRVALLQAADLRLISVWNPSFLTLTLGGLAAAWEGLLRDVHEGVCAGPVQLPPAPARARALGHLTHPDPRRIWPRLGLLSCWTDAQAARDLPAAQALLPGVEVQPKGLLATEAVVTLPLGAERPVAVLSHFVELLTPQGPRRVEELEPGEEGTLLVTTGGGLYRYHLRDRVRVQGRVGRTPGLVFLGKEDRVSDRRGEKLSEAFVAAALDRLAPGASFLLLAPADGVDPPAYALYGCGPALPSPGALDEALRENPHYAWCRALGQLGLARVLRVGPDAPARFLGAQQRQGQRLGDIKSSCLSPREGWCTVFDVLEER